ncbi:MAG: hypothetical protein BAJALOKI1v1_2030003 [Promethearchaeota archaeon]|nr:MAG: hypothetical protein BAJALOKI1v1_2030003 [Candidatus Lokiarchaeota archaeon]
MSKSEISYFDWELSYDRNEQKKDVETIKKEEKKTSLGFSKKEFREYLKAWEEKNLK